MSLQDAIKAVCLDDPVLVHRLAPNRPAFEAWKTRAWGGAWLWQMMRKFMEEHKDNPFGFEEAKTGKAIKAAEIAAKQGLKVVTVNPPPRQRRQTIHGRTTLNAAIAATLVNKFAPSKKFVDIEPGNGKDMIVVDSLPAMSDYHGAPRYITNQAAMAEPTKKPIPTLLQAMLQRLGKKG